MGHSYVSLVFTFVVLVTWGIDNLPTAVKAADPDPLQDFCVADLKAGGPFVNGYPCKAPELATTEDFAYAGLTKMANLTGNPLGGAVTPASVLQWPALNTLGLSLARVDINPGGIIMPHTHNLATEILFCLEGEIYTGFVTNSNNAARPNKLFAKIVKKGEAFLYPRGLLHFQLNKGTVPSRSLVVFNGQNPGVQLMPVSLFGTGVDRELLAKSFFITEAKVSKLESILSQFVDAAV